MPLVRLPGGDLGVHAAAGGDMVVNIFNQSGSQVRTEQRRTPTGKEIDVLIDKAVARSITGGGQGG